MYYSLVNLGPLSWPVEQVEQWALKVVGLDKEDAKKLKDQKIDGEALPTMTRGDFERYGIPGGPSSKLFEGVKALFPARFQPVVISEGRVISLVLFFFLFALLTVSLTNS
jgi:SAM domain (Sterile alpha motif)